MTSKSSEEANSSILTTSHVIKGRWKVVKKIGAGAFGEIYQAKNVLTNEMVAIKVERVDSKKQVLKLEVAVLKKLQDCPHVCRFITCGRFANFNYMVMELLGENLSELRRKQSDGKFSLPTVLQLGRQMLKSIEAVHELGYLHRDIKPSNFAMGLGPKKHNTFIIDFGLARRYLLPSGQVRLAREATGFRGTARYASINSHQSKDLGRRDDLWSLLYVLVEFAKGSLPWRKLKDKDQIGQMKIATGFDLVQELPSEFAVLMDHLNKLQYDERPDYEFMDSVLDSLWYKATGGTPQSFDWEVVETPKSSSLRKLAKIDKKGKDKKNEIESPGFSSSRPGVTGRQSYMFSDASASPLMRLPFGSFEKDEEIFGEKRKEELEGGTIEMMSVPRKEEIKEGGNRVYVNEEVKKSKNNQSGERNSKSSEGKKRQGEEKNFCKCTIC